VAKSLAFARQKECNLMVFKVILTAVLAIGVASAQGKKGGGSSGGMGDAPMARAPRQSRIDMIADRLKLTKEQKDDISKIFDNAQEKATPLNEQVRNGRSKVTEMLIAGKNSGEDWDSLMKAFTGVLAQQESVEAEAYQKMFAALDDKQKPKAGPVFEELMAGMFAGRDWKRAPGAAGGMGGMGGGMGSGMGEGSGRGR
jgi:Spy/CpxP family protein refolding chaperone